ncbi:armadillo-type protein, partial [Syncephalis pseudoplumigaleata]
MNAAIASRRWMEAVLRTSFGAATAASMEPFFRRKRNKGGSQGSITPPVSAMSISAPTVSPTKNDAGAGSHSSVAPMSPSHMSNSWTDARNSSLSASSTISSRMSNQSDGSGSLNLERPSEQAVLDEMLEQIMESMGLGEAQRKQMRDMSFQNKLKIVQSSQFKQISADKANRNGSKDRSTPEYYVKKMAETDVRSIPLKTWTALRVSLTTQPIAWVRQFIDLRGTQLVWDALGVINSRPNRRENEINIEIEIVKCLKSLLNNKWGTRDALNNEVSIYNLALSLDSPSIITRRLVAEVLTFICYCDIPHGHALVIRAMDKLQAARQNKHRFGAWMVVLEQTIEGRGRMGSMVGASDEYRRLGSDRELLEYVLSNIILVNAIVGVCDEVDLRQYYRNQLNACGLARLLRTIKEFANDLILLQLNKYQRESEDDQTELMDFNHAFAMPDMSSPAEVIETLLKSVEGTKAHDHLLSALQHLLLLRDDDDTRVQYFHLIDRLITQIVLDRRGVNDEFSSTYGRSVKAVIAGFNNEEKLQRMQRDFVTIKKKLDQTHKRNLDLEQQVKLGADGMVSQLQERNKSLEDLLRMSRTTVKSLQDQVTQLRTQYHAKLCEQDKQLQQLYEALKDEAEENTLLVNARESLIVENRLMKQMLWPDDDKAVPGKTVVKGVPNITHNALLKEIEKLKQDRGIIWNESNRPRLSGTGVDTVAMRNKKAFIETLRPKSIATTFDKDGMAGMGSPSPASPTTSPGHRSRHKFSAAGTPSLAGSIDKLESLQAVITELDSNGLASPRSPTDQASPSHRRDSSGSMKPLPMPPSKRQTISFNDIKQTQLSSSKPLREALMESIRQQRKDGDGDAKEEDTEQAT